MADIQQPESFGEGKHGTARRLVDAAGRAEREGRTEEAERLMDEATRTDPQAVEDALLESRASTGPRDPGRQAARRDAADGGGDAAVAAISRTVEPGSDAPDRSGITGPGSGADAS